MAEHKQTLPKLSSPLYSATGFYMLRAPALSAKVFLQLSAAGHISADCLQEDFERVHYTQQEYSFQLLRELAAQPQMMQALSIASPSLQQGLERLLRKEGSSSQQKRVYAGLLRYLIRMSTRPTPFGLFSGVASGTLAHETLAYLASPPLTRIRTRPDMSWLLALLHQIEKDRTLVAQLRVRLNQTAYLVGGRAVLPFADIYGTQDNRAISLRATAVVRTAFALTQDFILYSELQMAIHQAFPRATTEQVEHVLWQLWEHHFLISELHPPLTNACPADYVRQRLDRLRGVDEIKTGLTRILADASALDRAGIGAPFNLISTLVKDQKALISTEYKDKQPFQVDALLDMQSPLLHHSIGLAAAHAAELLLRQTPSPHGFRHLQEYKLLFLEKYGEQAEVPLLDLLSPENGLDAPAGYEKPPPAYARASTNRSTAADSRDLILLNLVAEALNKRDLEVELTEKLENDLESWVPNMEEAPLSLEIYLQLHAESREAIDRGEWTAVVGRSGGSLNAGRTFGRFFDLLGERSIEHLHDIVKREEALLPDVIFAEISYQPEQARLSNVTIHPSLRSYEIAVGVTPSVPPEHVLTLSDLVVGIQHGRFYLRSLRLGKEVRICQAHMLNMHLAPNICRFISEIASDGSPILNIFDWGAQASAPFLPRLVKKLGPSAKLVITPACWQIQSQTIVPTGVGSEETRWFRGLQRWREQWRVPRYVYLVEVDNRLLLDLENPLMAEELRDELKKYEGKRQIMLDELLPDFEHLWLRDEQNVGYFSEIVVPLLRTDAVDATVKSERKESVFIPQSRSIAPIERRSFPGGDWSYLKLYATSNQHEELLTDPLRELVRIFQECDLLDRWFFVRYADPEPHIRLRFHAKDGVDCAAILACVFPWCLQLAQRGLIQYYTLDTYEREIERYGGPEAIRLMEQMFTIDSVMVSDLLTWQRAGLLMLDPLFVAVFTLNYLFTSWGCDLQQRLKWTHQASEKYAFSKEFRPERKRYCDLLSQHGKLSTSLAEQRSLLLELLHPHEAFIGELGTQIHQLSITGKLWVTETALLSSLAHMHINRLLGVDRAREEQVYAFWRHTLDSLERRPEQSPT